MKKFNDKRPRLRSANPPFFEELLGLLFTDRRDSNVYVLLPSPKMSAPDYTNCWDGRWVLCTGFGAKWDHFGFENRNGYVDQNRLNPRNYYIRNQVRELHPKSINHLIKQIHAQGYKLLRPWEINNHRYPLLIS